MSPGDTPGPGTCVLYVRLHRPAPAVPFFFRPVRSGDALDRPFSLGFGLPPIRSHHVATSFDHLRFGGVGTVPRAAAHRKSVKRPLSSATGWCLHRSSATRSRRACGGPVGVDRGHVLGPHLLGDRLASGFARETQRAKHQRVACKSPVAPPSGDSQVARCARSAKSQPENAVPISL